MKKSYKSASKGNNLIKKRREIKCINTILQCNSGFFSYLILPSFRYNELRNFKALSLHNYGSTLLSEM